LKRLWKISRIWLFLLIATSAVLPTVAQEQRWSETKANHWYEKQPLPVGSNYVPDDAVNELEMWQAPTFDPKEIDKEFGWAQDIGMGKRLFPRALYPTGVVHARYWRTLRPKFGVGIPARVQKNENRLDVVAS
jgi:hypothetical protein